MTCSPDKDLHINGRCPHLASACHLLCGNESKMPRPKVQDSQRQRAAEACSYCRETKRRCTGKAPCSQCQRRGRSDECFITYLPRGFRSKEKHRAIQADKQRNDSICDASATSPRGALNGGQPATSNVGDLSTANAAETFRPLSPSESQEENEAGDCADLDSATAGLGARPKDSPLAASGPRMLLNCHGEKGMWQHQS